jgi:hypothetical protein
VSGALTRRQVTGVLLTSHAAALGIGYALSSKHPIDTEATNEGYFRKNVTRILYVTVESLKGENRLLVYSYKGSAKIKTERTVFWILYGYQELVVPAVVSYYLDLSGLKRAGRVTFDEHAKLVRVRLPKLTIGDIAFEPENATTVSGGPLTWNGEQVEVLRKLNYAGARRAMIAQAQQAGLLNAARRQAIDNVENYFSIPLHVAGQPDVKVAATFE